MTDKNVNGKAAELLEELRKAQRAAGAVGHDLDVARSALREAGANAAALTLGGHDPLTGSDGPVDQWPSHDEFIQMLLRERGIRDNITRAQQSLRGMGIGPELSQ